MKDFLKKSLVYSLIATIALPVWLITGYMSADKAKASGGLITTFSLDTEIFSPNGDDIKDQVGIVVGFNEKSTAAITIVDGQDNLIKKIYKSSSEGVYNPDPQSWDGKTGIAVVVPDGEYTVMVTATPVRADGLTETQSKKVIVDNFSKPQLQNVGFTSNGIALKGDTAKGFYLQLGDTVWGPDHLLKFSDASIASENLAAEKFGLFLTNPSAQQTADLTAYYSTKPEPFKNYLIEAAQGQKPFAYIKGDGTDKVKLIDAAKFDLLKGVESEMTIPDNFVHGIYNLSGQIKDIEKNFGDVAFQLEIGNLTAPKLETSSSPSDPLGVDVTVAGAPNTKVICYVTTEAKEGMKPIELQGMTDTEGKYIFRSIDFSAMAEGQYEITALLENNYGYFSPVYSLNVDVVRSLPENGVIEAGSAPMLILNLDTFGSAKFDFGGGDVDEDRLLIHAPIAIHQNDGVNDISFVINNETAVTGDFQNLNLPTILDTAQFKTILEANNIPSNAMVFNIGSDAVGGINFSNPIKITVGNKANSQTGYIKDGKYTEITTVCDNVDAPTIFSATGECKGISADGQDLIIWTKHLTDFVTYKNAVAAPEFTISGSDIAGTKTIHLEWMGTGAEKYKIYVDNDKIIEVDGSAADNEVRYVKDIKVLDYGTHYVRMSAVKALTESEKTAVKSVTFIVPAPAAQNDVTAPVVSTSAPSVLAPTKAQAAPATEEKKAQTPSDDNGIIKGEEQKTDEDTGINWTPWIVLFVLIILAGAATGGYFYWFAGKEEEEQENAEIKNPVKKDEVVEAEAKVVVREKTQSKKNKKRW